MLVKRFLQLEGRRGRAQTFFFFRDPFFSSLRSLSLALSPRQERRLDVYTCMYASLAIYPVTLHLYRFLIFSYLSFSSFFLLFLFRCIFRVDNFIWLSYICYVYTEFHSCAYITKKNKIYVFVVRREAFIYIYYIL